MNSLPRTLHLFAEGRVQGVGYREFARRAALHHALSGWVRNRADGSVEARVSGAAHELKAFAEALRVGPAGAAVRRLRVVEDGEPPEESGFVVAPSR